ncbi:MAG: hypothetical protein IIZ10_10510 [Solobacterium sp.]|nr:hypothetical protein [Solobacterium sp.]
MAFRKKVHAVVLSKGLEEVEDPPLLGASGGNPMLALASMQDESHSMWKRSVVYSVSFRTGTTAKEFFTNRALYEQLEPGDEGILVYSGSTLISFKKL